jgi:hypothetical protein
MNKIHFLTEWRSAAMASLNMDNFAAWIEVFSSLKKREIASVAPLLRNDKILIFIIQ